MTASQEKYEHQRRFASLTITGKKLQPDVISAALKLSPTRAFMAGDRKGMSEAKWGHGYWGISTEGIVEADNLEEHIAWLLDQVEPIGVELAKVLSEEGVKARIFCFFETEKMNDGIEFSTRIIKRLSSLDLPIAIDIYNSSL